MISLRRSSERRREHHRRQEAWLTFDQHRREDPLAEGFRALQFLDEELLPPGAHCSRHPRVEAEVLTFVREGALAWADATGRASILHAGEFQCLSGTGARPHSLTNASRFDSAQLFQVWLRPGVADVERTVAQKRFSTAERRNRLCLVASADGRLGSLRLHQSTLVHSSLVDRGRHLMHPLASSRCAWLHVVRGEIDLVGQRLATGDAAAITDELVVSLTAYDESELLLVELDDAFQLGAGPATNQSRASRPEPAAPLSRVG